MTRGKILILVLLGAALWILICTVVFFWPSDTSSDVTYKPDLGICWVDTYGQGGAAADDTVITPASIDDKGRVFCPAGVFVSAIPSRGSDY